MIHHSPDMTPPVTLPEGFVAGHFTDREGWTGCTVLVAPPGAVGAGQVLGGGPGTRESDLLSPATSTPGPEAVLLTGGSAFGLAAADGVVRWLAEHGRGYETPAARVPLVSAAVVYDLMLGDPEARPDADAGYAAAAAATSDAVERGSVGAGTGCSTGKVLGFDPRTKGGLGAARATAGDATLTAVAAVNPVGDVIGADGEVLAGPWRDGAFVRTVDMLAAGEFLPMRAGRESTTLVCVMTDARLTKVQAWLAARAAGTGIARAVSPCGTAFDGDMAFCLASGAVEADPMLVSVMAAEVVSAAIRDAVEQATGAPGCPSAAERRRTAH
jgi:L-aminopeptidase/D-esterase-like protein